MVTRSTTAYMNEEQNSVHPPSDDIDLLSLAERTLSFFRRFRWLFIGAALLGIALGTFLYSSLPRLYKARMVVHTFMLTNAEHLQIVKGWNELLQKREYAALAERFNCPEDLLHDLKQIKSEEIKQVFTPDNPNGFIVDISLVNNARLPELQNALVHGFENTPYVRERIATKKANLTELIGKTSHEIRRLDSTKKIIEKIIEGNGHSSSSLIIDISTVNRQLIEMNEKLLTFKENLQFANAVQVLQNFSKFKKPDSPNRILWLLVGLVFCLSIAWFIAVVSTVRGKLQRRAIAKRISNTND